MAQPKKRSPANTHHVKRKQDPKVTSSRTLSLSHQHPRWHYAVWLVGGVTLGLVVAFWMWTSTSKDFQDALPISVVTAPDYHSLLIDAQDDDIVLFGSHAGVQHSNDGGLTWSQGSLVDVDAMILASSLSEPNRIYAAGHDVFQVSRDRGATWQEVTHNLPGTDIHGFAQNPNEPARLYAFVVGFGGWTSSDRGATWQPFGSQPPGGGSWLVLASNGETLYAATDVGISRSDDEGTSWTLLRNQPGKMTFFGLAVSASNPDTIYASTPVGVVRSTNQGDSWTMLPSPNVMALGIAVSQRDSGRLMVVDDEGQIFLSTDGGTTWESPPEGNA